MNLGLGEQRTFASSSLSGEWTFCDYSVWETQRAYPPPNEALKLLHRWGAFCLLLE